MVRGSSTVIRASKRSRRADSNALSNSPGPCTSKDRSAIPSAPAALSVSLKTCAEYGLAAFQRTATREARGRSSWSSSRCFPPRSAAMRLSPVMFPPGRARLATSPLPNGSPAAVMTMGIVAVALLAAMGASVPPAAMTSTLRRTSSAANYGSKSSRFSAYRRSKTTFFPSTQPNPRRASGRADRNSGETPVPALRMPIR